MKKSSLFISAVLTTFVLTVLVGGITAYRSLTGASTQVTVPQSTPTAQVAMTTISPQDAAQIAAQFLGRSDLYSVESDFLNGTSAYKVTFSSGDVVYVSPQGQVVSVVAAPPAILQNNVSSFQSVQPVFPSFEGEGEHENGDHD